MPSEGTLEAPSPVNVQYGATVPLVTHPALPEAGEDLRPPAGDSFVEQADGPHQARQHGGRIDVVLSGQQAPDAAACRCSSPRPMKSPFRELKLTPNLASDEAKTGISLPS